jgi:hypothetical protein
MGNIISGTDFTGRLGPASVYKMRGHNKMVIRSKGGAKKSRIKRHPNFDATRRLNQEWAAVTMAAKNIRMKLSAIKLMADYNVSGPLNALVKKIQNCDMVNEKGKKSILLSRYPEFISSFQFNRQTLFDSVIRQQLEVNIDKPIAIATMSVPLLQPNINFFPNPRYAHYRLVFDVGAVSDQVWDEESNAYKALISVLPLHKHFYTGWFVISSIQPAATYQIVPTNTGFSSGADMLLIAGAGIQYGMPSPDGSIQPVPYAGAARILKCV